eukprot:TRINITY_DN50475_c0_g1_i1.p1 TRINITY_DN50475_c0_g1~~TRINITY_DN50475_c0_g1_i1.p1  ORF type:complete len:364 (-),score=63.48 TRINITY_DN50475_c0_g1_i1:77-1168(-)
MGSEALSAGRAEAGSDGVVAEGTVDTCGGRLGATAGAVGAITKGDANNSGATTEDRLWPALQGSGQLRSLISGGRTTTSGHGSDARRLVSSGSDDRLRLCREGQHSRTSDGDGPRCGSTSDRVNFAVGQAFERLWRDRPLSTDSPSNTSEDSALLATVDGYISQYFRHVAELSRESVYQAHQRDILYRMREDLIAGDRSGNMRELDKMIRRVDLDDQSLRTEIASLMRIADNNAQTDKAACVDCSPTACRPLEMGCAYFLGEADYPPINVSSLAVGDASTGTGSPASLPALAERESASPTPSRHSANSSVKPPLSAGDSGHQTPARGLEAVWNPEHSSGMEPYKPQDTVGKDVPPCQQDCTVQ